MVLTFRDYYSNDIKFEEFGEINESHQYADSISSVMDKLTFYVKRNIALEGSSLNESAKRAYRKDIRLNRDERIAAACIFSEMLKQYEENMQKELSVYEEIINKGSLLKEGVEYDVDKFFDCILDEGLKDKIKGFFKKGKEGVTNVAKTVIDGAKDVTVNGIDVIKAKKDDLVTWAKDAKKDFEEKYTALKELINDIVKKGIDSIQKFIDKILDVFTSIGDNLVDVVKKLGGLKMDKGEKPATIDLEDADGVYRNANGDEEKSFINNIILRVEAILSKDKENATKLMTESYLEESIVDNKFIAWLAGYKQDGTKMSWWKCILIGLCASLIVWLLPKVLVLAGLSGAITAFIAGLVGMIWNGIGLLRLIYRRNKERKEGEKFFDTKTAIFFTLSLIANVFSVATFLNTIGPLMREICNTMGWTGGDDMSKFGEAIYGITKKISPKDCFHEGGLTEVSEEIKNIGGDFRGNDLIKSKEDVLNAVREMPGATDANVDALDKFLSAPLDAKGTSAVYDALDKFKDNADLPFVAVFDTSKWGGSGPIRQAIEALKDQLPDSAVLGTVGSEATKEASNGLYGFANYLTGINQEQANMIFQKAAEIAGEDMSTLTLHTYGTGEIANVITTVSTIEGAFDVLAPNVPFLPMVMPFFDDKKWGDYKIRFASATRGSAAYVVDKVEMIPDNKLAEIENGGKALDTLRDLHKKAWDEFKSLKVEENKKNKKKKEIEEPQYVVFYIKPNESTGNENDKPKEGEKKSNKEKSAIGIVIDTLTMMCADVCNFNESVEIRRRPRPYFMKGLLSRISFRPTKERDNDTKDFIRTTLGQTMKTLVTQNVLYGMGKKYIDSTVDGKEAQFKIREKILGSDKKVYPDKTVFELGNFTPKELIDILSDKNKNNKIAYDFLDGAFATKITIRQDKNGNVKASAIKDSSTIENVKYYRVSKTAYQESIDKWEKEVKKWEKDGKVGKKPKKPTFIKGEDKEYYKRLSKKMATNPDFRRKKVYDFVDIRIVPLLKKGPLYRELVDNSRFKKVLYKEDEENNVKLNKEVIAVLKPFLFRPEKTFAKDDEYQLTQLLKDQGVEGEHLGWFKKLFKDEEQLHDTFKDIVETIWDYLSENRRKVFKGRDLTPNQGKKNEDVDYTLFDSLIEEFFNEEYDEETEYDYDLDIINETKTVLSFENFLIERY